MAPDPGSAYGDGIERKAHCMKGPCADIPGWLSFSIWMAGLLLLTFGYWYLWRNTDWLGKFEQSRYGVMGGNITLFATIIDLALLFRFVCVTR